jgi:flagellar secretion chaperone FliS
MNDRRLSISTNEVTTLLETLPLNDPDVFLIQEVNSSSPARLRWLLVRKAHGLAEHLSHVWGEPKATESQAETSIGVDPNDQWLLRLHEILTELLEGVTDPRNPAAKTIADLYIFLCHETLLAWETKDPLRIGKVAEVLAIESDTWQSFVEQELKATANPQEPLFPTFDDLSEPTLGFNLSM